MSTHLYGQPFVSRRESIAWIPSTPAFKDSDVLVLSSRTTLSGVGAILFYLDLRLSLPLNRSSKINWGFAGLRHTLSTSPFRLQWEHSTIDSRDDGLVDEGEMIHRDGVEIETGIGFNPATGQKEKYEEIWRDECLPAGSPFIFVSSSTRVEAATAVMALLGPHALALAQEPEDLDGSRRFQAVRMHRQTSAGQDGEKVTWEMVFSTGSSRQEQELEELIGLANRTCQYVRGSSVCLGTRSWIVWDSGTTSDN